MARDVRAWSTLLIGLIWQLPSPAASFDCVKARSIPEKLICGDSELSRKDEELAKVYAKAKAAAPDKAAFSRSATDAWRRREAICKDAECVTTWMNERIAFYSLAVSTMASQGTPPAGGAPIKAVRGLGQPAPVSTGDPRRDELRRQIDEAQKCIDFSQRTIDAENEIGATVGYVNKVSLYEAGRNLVICRHNLERHRAELANLHP